MATSTSIRSGAAGTTANHNLFAAMAAAFPSDLGACAVETETGLFYSWQDLLDSTAMVANLLQSLDLPPGSRIAVQVEKSVEALILYLATLRAGLVYLPLNTAYQSAEMAYFIENAQPAVLVCSGRNFGWVSKMAFLAGTQHVFTLNDDRTGSLLERAAPQIELEIFSQPGPLLPTPTSSNEPIEEFDIAARKSFPAPPPQAPSVQPSARQEE